eukprot:TRINITY_DN5123_c5_g1_i1.p1 TRINITY_DN5123_c5_g1~~TRINITY_DN5123_c5_g1_i1.p1  ORF type:complete len:155 (+),score=16.82 TRINITY_DN5123_c5_g1_i1:124-588(+)
MLIIRCSRCIRSYHRTRHSLCWKPGQKVEIKTFANTWTTVAISEVLPESQQVVVIANNNGKPVAVDMSNVRQKKVFDFDRAKEYLITMTKLLIVGTSTLLPMALFSHYLLTEEESMGYTPVCIRNAERDPNYDLDLQAGKIPVTNLRLPMVEEK